jgi:anaerobic nitric oxide reductase transcription regulator
MLEIFIKVALDLAKSLPSQNRYERLLEAVRRVVPCDAAAILCLVNGDLVPLICSGLGPQVMAKKYALSEHPRLATILAAREPVRFPSDSLLPDPFDEFIETEGTRRTKVHSCMGCPLFVDDELVGILTLDAFDPHAFDQVDAPTLAAFAALAAATLKNASIIEKLERSAKESSLVARQLLDEARQRSASDLIGQSQIMKDLRREIELVSGSDLAVLITGETGTGKELVARALHHQSSRSDRPFVQINCAALPESLAESELFGHVKGAYTGATSGRQGRFELADTGTLFLDEIGELPPGVQAKLLRVLQFGEVQRVGSDTVISVNVRIIAATNRDLAFEVKSGRFRADLYHRLSVYPLRVSPLRERGEDIKLLSEFFLENARINLGLKQVKISPSAMLALCDYSWPGNVRELEHVMMRAALRSSGGKTSSPVMVEKQHLDLANDKKTESHAANDPAINEQVQIKGKALSTTVEDFERTVIQTALHQAGGNWAKTARYLSVDRGNLYRKAKRLGILNHPPRRADVYGGR